MKLAELRSRSKSLRPLHGIGLEQPYTFIDAGSVTFTGGTISVHNEEGLPLRALGLRGLMIAPAGPGVTRDQL
jgi:hypothetical protein